MLNQIMTPEFLIGAISILGGTVAVLHRLNLIHFGRPKAATIPVPEPLATCPDHACKQEIAALIASKVDRDPETGGAHHIAHETRTKLGLYRPMDLQDAICKASIAELRGEIKEIVDDRLKTAEDRIIAAVRSNGR